MITKCPSCGAVELVHDARDVPYAHKGKTTVTPLVIGEFCPARDEIVLEREQGDRYGGLVSAFQRQVNATYVNLVYTAAVQRRLNLDQHEVAEISGGGVNAFPRYGIGKTKPSLVLVKLLKFLDYHPDLLAEVETA